jgi:hypothetical protein
MRPERSSERRRCCTWRKVVEADAVGAALQQVADGVAPPNRRAPVAGSSTARPASYGEPGDRGRRRTRRRTVHRSPSHRSYETRKA